MLFSLKSSNTVISGCHLKAGILAAYRKLVLDCRVADPKLVEPESHGYDPRRFVFWFKKNQRVFSLWVCTRRINVTKVESIELPFFAVHLYRCWETVYQNLETTSFAYFDAYITSTRYHVCSMFATGMPWSPDLSYSQCCSESKYGMSSVQNSV